MQAEGLQAEHDRLDLARQVGRIDGESEGGDRRVLPLAIRKRLGRRREVGGVARHTLGDADVVEVADKARGTIITQADFELRRVRVGAQAGGINRADAVDKTARGRPTFTERDMVPGVEGDSSRRWRLNLACVQVAVAIAQEPDPAGAAAKFDQHPVATERRWVNPQLQRKVAAAEGEVGMDRRVKVVTLPIKRPARPTKLALVRLYMGVAIDRDGLRRRAVIRKRRRAVRAVAVQQQADAGVIRVTTHGATRRSLGVMGYSGLGTNASLVSARSGKR